MCFSSLEDCNVNLVENLVIEINNHVEYLQQQLEKRTIQLERLIAKVHMKEIPKRTPQNEAGNQYKEKHQQILQGLNKLKDPDYINKTGKI